MRGQTQNDMTKSKVVNDVLWTERYRPTSLADVGLDPDTRQVLQEYLDAGDIPHLLFLGPAGSGKTTVARILMQALDCVKLVLNASSERGIDTVRLKIGNFVQALTMSRLNVVFLDEADQMTSDAQTALRNLMESYADHARFILTGNYGHKIIGPIQSRCQLLTLAPPPLKERFRILSSVLQKEGIEAGPKIVLGYAEKYPDLRKMLFGAQKGYLSTGQKELPAATTQVSSASEMYEALVKKQWAVFRGYTTTAEFEPTQAMRELFWAIPDDHPRAGFLRHTIGRGVHESGFTPDPIVLFLGVVAEAMEGL